MPFGDESNHQFNGLTVRGGFGIANSTGGLATVDYDRFAALTRYAVAMRAQGYYAETFPRACVAGTTIGITGTIYYGAVGLLAGDVVTNMHCHVQTLGSGFSGIGLKMGLYSKTGALLASSVDVSASFGSTGLKTVAMATPYTVLTDDLYYIAYLGIATTMPILIRCVAGITGGGFNPVSPSVFGMFGTTASQTDLGAQQTISFTLLPISYWMAVS